MKYVSYKNYKEQIDSASGFQIITIRENNTDTIKPRINNSRFSYASKTCSKSNKKEGE